MNENTKAVDVQHPWQLTRDQWEAERERVRPCFAQSNFTKTSGSESVARHARLKWLLGGVRDAASQRLKAAGRGEITISEDEANELLEQLQTPVTYDDVCAHGAVLGGAK